jgi:hypothetical protein
VQEDDILAQKMADLMQNQFGLKPKMQGPTYTPPFPEWYYNVIQPPRVKLPTEFTKFSGQDDTSTTEHIARYLMQLGECSSEEAFRVRYFPMSLTARRSNGFHLCSLDQLAHGRSWNGNSTPTISAATRKRS